MVLSGNIEPRGRREPLPGNWSSQSRAEGAGPLTVGSVQTRGWKGPGGKLEVGKHSGNIRTNSVLNLSTNCVLW